jgi:hypothetical protein
MKTPGLLIFSLIHKKRTILGHHTLEISKERVGRQVELKLWVRSARLCWYGVGSSAMSSSQTCCYS